MSAGLDVAARGWRSAERTTTGARLRTSLLSARFWVVVVLLVAVGVGFLVYLSIQRLETGALNPRSTERDGGRAFVEVLRTQSYPVETTDSYGAARQAVDDGSTLLIFDAESSLTAQAATELSERGARGDASLVLLEPSLGTLTAMGLPVSPAGRTPAADPSDDPTFLPGIASVTPGCADPLAQRAGTLSGGGQHYRLIPGTAGSVCFPAPERPFLDSGTVVRVPQTQDTPEATVVGNWGIASNAYLDENGNAALLIGAATTRDSLVVYQPERGDQPGQPAAAGEPSTVELLPPSVVAALLWIIPTMIAVVLWRGRRLGALVVEPRPVLVRAVELQEGRAGLYRTQEARMRALGHLRSRTRRLLAARLRAHEPHVESAIAAASGRPPEDVVALLVTAQPRTDAEFATLAKQLQILESEVSPQ